MQFSIQRLFVAIMLVALGLSSITYGWLQAGDTRINFFCLLGGTFLGAGVGYLFQKTEIGALTGAFLSMVILIALDAIRLGMLH